MSVIIWFCCIAAVCIIATLASNKLSICQGYEIGSQKIRNSSLVISLFYGVLQLFVIKFTNQPFGSDNLSLTLVNTAIVSIIITLSMIDYYYEEVSTLFVAVIAILGIIHIFLDISTINSSIMMGAGLYFIYFLIFMITNAFGGGDVKLAGALGLSSSFSTFGIFVIAPFGIAVAIYGVIKLFKKNVPEKIPFVPFMTAGFCVSTLYAHFI